MKINDFIDFIQKCPTACHAGKELVDRLQKAGFILLDEKQQWSLEKGKSYLVVRNSLVFAFRIPQKKISSLILLASHVDSPSLKLKPHPIDTQHEILRLNTEIYGSPLLHTWLDRNLAIAGKITFLDEKNTLKSELVHLKTKPITIPNIAIHLERSIGEKGLHIHKQDHLKALFSLNTKQKDLESLLKQECSFKTLLGFDLFLTSLENPSLLGFNQEFLAAPRLDNLTSVYAACHAMQTAKAHPETIQAAIFWDHEEIGSTTQVGADSSFMNQILKRMSIALKIDEENLYQIKSRSLCLSGDLAHGFHPNFPEKYDSQNAPYLGKGIVLKFNANQKYATSGEGAAKIVLLCQNNEIPLQKFASRSDMLPGSTVGSIMAAQTEIATIDLGISGLAMHSIREMICPQDELSLCKLFKIAIEQYEP